MQKAALLRVKDLLWALVFAGLFASILRFAAGLGAATGLNDASPWGLWIAFKLGFVALSGGGFTLAAMVYIFRLESFRPVLRRAILLALLGYGSFILSLLFDLGLPWHIYMPIINWQHYSVMFEIAWCVLLYFSVLVMEFGPVILEYPWFRHPVFRAVYHFLHRATVPLVIAGIVLSTLHQSSLGSLFLIMPQRVHPLWYSPLIPVLFFISAIAAGLLALIVEGFIAEHLSGRRLRLDLLARLGNTGAFVLWLYLGIRFGDLLLRGTLPAALDGSWQSQLFVLEALIGGLLPAVLLLSPLVRRSRAGLLTSAALGIAGVLSQRMSLSLFTMWRPEQSPYFPSAYEIIIAFAIPAAAGLVYLLFIEHLAVFERTIPLQTQPEDGQVYFDRVRLAYREDNQSWLARRSGIAVVVIALCAAALPPHLASAGPQLSEPVAPALGWERMRIDGDRNEIGVNFPHLEHQERLVEANGGRAAACQVCHHLSVPGDESTGCWECHQQYAVEASIFDHNLHTQTLGGNPSCEQCHQGDHRSATAKACIECHESMPPAPGELQFSYHAPGYMDAMHAACLGCHQEQAPASGNPDLAGCGTCHFTGEVETQLAHGKLFAPAINK